MNKKIVVLILSTQSEDYKQFKLALRETWLNDLSSSDCRYFFYEGGHDCNQVIGDTIMLTDEDSLNGTYNKFLGALEVLNKVDIDYQCVYRTNLSSYIDVKKLLEFISKVENLENLIAGVIGKTYELREKMYVNRFLRKISRLGVFGRSIYFVSGSGFFLGKNLVKKLLTTSRIKNAFIDDVMIGYMLNLQQHDIKEIGRWDVLDFGYSYYMSRQLVKEGEDLFHYRLKTKDRRFDSLLIRFLHNEHVREELIKLGQRFYL